MSNQTFASAKIVPFPSRKLVAPNSEPPSIEATTDGHERLRRALLALDDAVVGQRDAVHTRRVEHPPPFKRSYRSQIEHGAEHVEHTHRRRVSESPYPTSELGPRLGLSEIGRDERGDLAFVER